MSDQFVEACFLLAFWAPPLTVLAGALLLLAPGPIRRRTPVRSHVRALTH